MNLDNNSLRGGFMLRMDVVSYVPRDMIGLPVLDCSKIRRDSTFPSIWILEGVHILSRLISTILDRILEEVRLSWTHSILTHLGLLLFADPKPLGTRGFMWLQIHLANLAGRSYNCQFNFARNVQINSRRAVDICDGAYGRNHGVCRTTSFWIAFMDAQG